MSTQYQLNVVESMLADVRRLQEAIDNLAMAYSDLDDAAMREYMDERIHQLTAIKAGMGLQLIHKKNALKLRLESGNE